MWSILAKHQVLRLGTGFRARDFQLKISNLEFLNAQFDKQPIHRINQTFFVKHRYNLQTCKNQKVRDSLHGDEDIG